MIELYFLSKRIGISFPSPEFAKFAKFEEILLKCTLSKEFSYRYCKCTIKGFALQAFDFVLIQGEVRPKQNSTKLNKTKPTKQSASQPTTSRNKNPCYLKRKFNKL